MLTLSRISKEATAKLGCSGYADSPNPSSRPQSAHLRNMFSTTPNVAEERSARKLKKENRVRTPLRGFLMLRVPDKDLQIKQFYNFLTRSRSRSRSKTDHSPPRNRDSIHQVPPNGRRKEHPDSKPPHRIPSRPLSSTTTATNTTITPGTPKAKKKPQSSIPVPTTKRPENVTNDVDGFTPSQLMSNRRKINFFGISIPGPRRPSLSSSRSRSRSRSRPGTPRVSVDVPPLPTFGFEEESRGLPQIQPSQPSSRTSSPSPPDTRPHPKQDMASPPSLGSLVDHDLPPLPPPHPTKEASSDARGSSSKIRGFFSGLCLVLYFQWHICSTLF